MNKALLITTLLSIITGCRGQQSSPDIPPNQVVPGEQLARYQEMELIGFIHFTVNTFTDKEWGYGDEDPAIFNPTQLDAEQWAKTAAEAGMKQLILTAKHHDGFCLWPSKYNEHNISKSPYKNGNGDIVDEFVKACRKYGLKVGLYLSPWDRNHKDYGRPEYITYYKNQLRELLTGYGEINEIWFDGANGGDGYYGGSNEERRIDPATYYGWNEIFSLVKTLQPDIKIFSDAGPNVHWIGNEKGYAGFTFWSTINTDNLVIGQSDTDYLNQGDPDGNNWIVGQCDVSIRPGWFYHADEDDQVKTPQELVDIYYKSVGRNAILLLNLPPDQRGLIHENDVKSLMEFRQVIDETFDHNLASQAKAEASNTRMKSHLFAAKKVLDDDPDTYWATDDDIAPASLTLQLPGKTQFDRIMLQEPIRLGQRVSKFNIEIPDGNSWKTIFEGTTIGYKRFIRIDPVMTDKIRFTIEKANNTIAISNVALFLSSENE